MFDTFDTVFVYTRADAFADGVLIDVTEQAHMFGFRASVAITDSVQTDVNAIPAAHAYQTPAGRLNDVLEMAANSIRQAVARGNGDTDTLLFVLKMHTEAGSKYRAKMLIHGGDDGKPCVTIMRPDED